MRSGPSTEADLRIAIAARYDLLGSRDPLIYATAKMTSFGPNDDLTANSFPPLSTLGLGAQAAPCSNYYTAQVNGNVGANKANYTLHASGNTLQNQPWPMNSEVDSRTIGNFAGLAGGDIILGQGQGYNGRW